MIFSTHILDFLPDKQLFVVEAICSKWQKCLLKLLKQNMTLKELDHYSSEFKYKNKHNDIRFIINNNNNFTID